MQSETADIGNLYVQLSKQQREGKIDEKLVQKARQYNPQTLVFAEVAYSGNHDSSYPTVDQLKANLRAKGLPLSDHDFGCATDLLLAQGKITVDVYGTKGNRKRHFKVKENNLIC